MILLVEVEGGGIWTPLAQWEDTLPPSVTPYNEAYFCTHCGRVWCRRRWLLPTGEPIEASWWVTLHQCHLPPFTAYDLLRWPSLPTPIQELMCDEFLNDPGAFGYTGYSPLGDAPGAPSER